MTEQSGKSPFRFLTPLAVVAAAIFSFVALAALVGRGAPLPIDHDMLVAVRSAADPEVIAGPDWFARLMFDVTALGGSPVLTLLVALLAGYLAVRRRWASMALLILVVVGQSLAVDLMKQAFDRPRPDIVPRLAEVSSRSFPSGHAASAASVYLLLAAMLAPSLETRAARRYVVASATLLALLVGMSRVALGVHYPSDVLAGWSFGVAWTAGWIIAARRMKWL